MGVSGSSSKRKSSKRKKSDKVSSKRKKDKRKESKKRRRDYDSVPSYSDDESFDSDSSSSSDHKRRLKKSKKRRLRDYSASSYSDDYSKSSDSDSLSSHDNDNKTRKWKRLKISSKGAKKKSQKRFSSPDSDKDAHRVKKRKRSTKNSVKPKKKSLKKKLKKHASSSSSSDDNTTDGKRQKNKKLLNKESKTQIGRESCKGHRKTKIRSPRCSSLSISDDRSVSVGHSDEALAPVSNTVNNSRRLKSVITIVNHSSEEEDKWEKDPNKEEIVYDHDDYPSPRSLDSYEGENKRESNNDSQGASDERMVVEHFASEEITEPGESETNGGQQNKDDNYQHGGAHTDNIEKGKETEDDLESILRQKALENLRKFRVGPKNIRNLIESEVKGSSSTSADIIQNKSSESGIPSTQEVDQRIGLTLNSEFSREMEVKKQTEGVNFEKESKMDKHIATHTPDGKALVGCSKEDSTSSKAVLTEAVPRSDISLGAEDTNPDNLSIIEPTSSDRLISEEHILEKPESEAKEGSEFEQKTMSVMRGGEMVQVSYKVYIPKRAPALGRRQLRR